MDAPLRYDPRDVSGESLTRLETILNVAVSGHLIDADDAAAMLSILRMNPHARISRLGQRLSLVESVIEEMKGLDARISIALEYSQAELMIVRDAIETIPHWRRRGTNRAEDEDDNEQTPLPESEK